MEKNKLFLEILRMRQHLQALSQISFSYSQINKTFKRLEDMDYPEMMQLKIVYLGFYAEILELSKKIEHEQKISTT